MRRVLHIPAMDLREGDKVFMGDSSTLGSPKLEDRETFVMESRPCEDNDGTWYLKFTNDGWSQFTEPFQLFTLLLEI